MIISKIKKFFLKFKKNKILLIFFIFLIVFIFYFGYRLIYKKTNNLNYVIEQVKRGDFVLTVSGTGQVSGLNQLDIKSKVSGEIVKIYKNLGQEIKAGEILALIDTKDAEIALKDAERALEIARLELDKLIKPVDDLTLLQAENNLLIAKESKQKAEENLKKAYEDGFNKVSDAFINLAEVIVGLQDILFSNSFNKDNQWNIDFYANSISKYTDKVLVLRNNVYDKYINVKQIYDENFTDYKLASRFSDKKDIESLILKTYETTKLIAELVKDVNNFIQYYQDKLIERNLKPVDFSFAHISTLNTYSRLVNSDLLSIFSVKQLIQDSREAILNYDRLIEERSLYLKKLKEGPDELDIRTKKINIQQKEDALLKAKKLLDDHYIRMPFSGILAKINVKKGDNVSVGSNLFTVVTKQKIAEIFLNEVDVVKVKIGQKAILTFDAVPDFYINGQVVEIDALGSNSQGVVSYVVKIEFDTQDERIKSSMSVSADIVVDEKNNVLLIPNSAIKNQNGEKYVEVLKESDVKFPAFKTSTIISLKNPPLRKIIEVGISNYEVSEVLSGLKEGDFIVVREVQNFKDDSKNRKNSIGIPGFNVKSEKMRAK